MEKNTLKNNTKAWTAKTENRQLVSTDKVHNLLIVDESGSMGSIYSQALNGMNQTIKGVQEAAVLHPEQPQELTLVTFDTSHYNEIFSGTPAKDLRALNTLDYRPCGCTPLYDAMGKALTDLEEKVKENEKVLVTVITDGYENASCEYTLEDIRRLVERLDEKGWLFTYIGANQDSWRVAQSMAIDDALNFEATPQGTDAMFNELNEARMDYYADAADCVDSMEFKRMRKGNFFRKRSDKK